MRMRPLHSGWGCGTPRPLNLSSSPLPTPRHPSAYYALSSLQSALTSCYLSYKQIAIVTPLECALTGHPQLIENTTTSSLAECAVTDFAAASSLESALTENTGGWGHILQVRGFSLPARRSDIQIEALPSCADRDPGPAGTFRLVTSLLYYFLRRSWLERMLGQRAKTEVVRPPRGVNSPRTTHHSGRTVSTMSRRILLTAFS
jgi:hypothetical protein